MKAGFLFLLLFLLAFGSQAQKKQKVSTQAQIQKQMEALESDPNVKAAMKKAGINSLSDLQEDEEIIIKIPKRNEKLLLVANKVLTENNIQPYLAGLKSSLIESLPPKIKTQWDTAYSLEVSNSLKASKTAVALYYDNKPELALIIAARAAALPNPEPAFLNNYAALLNINGFPHKSIPILKNLITKFPANTTVLNNLAQAYLALGDVTKAEELFKKAIAASPTHVESNKTLGRIYLSRGQTAKAKFCLLKSLEGGYTRTAKEAAEQAGATEDEIDNAVIKAYKDFKAPAYFNLYKYKLPRFSRNVNESVEVDQLHNEFRLTLGKEIARYDRLIEEESQKVNKNAENVISEFQKSGAIASTPPLFEKGWRMIDYWSKKFTEWMEAEGYPSFLKMSQKEDEIKKAYHAEFLKIRAQGSPNECSQIEALDNKYLPLYNQNQSEFLDKFIPQYQGYLNELLYWYPFTDVLGHTDGVVYSYMRSYLQDLVLKSRSFHIPFPSCSPPSPLTAEGEPVKEDEKDCPFSFELDLGVAEMSADCKSFGFSVNAGVSFSIEKEFGGETTLAIGIGMGISIPENLPIIDISGSISASEQIYITFDSDNKPSDFGLKVGASASGSLGLSGGPISIGATNSATGVSAGYKLSLINAEISISAPQGTGLLANAFK